MNAKVIAFTKVIFTDSTKYITEELLHSYGIPIFNDLPELGSGKTFRYQSGVILTEENLKGPVLVEVLEKLSKAPHKIIFIDDLEQHKSVDATCQELGLSCIAFHYLATRNAPPLDEEIAHLQMQALVKDHKWISDEEAKILLAN